MAEFSGDQFPDRELGDEAARRRVQAGTEAAHAAVAGNVVMDHPNDNPNVILGYN